MAWTKWEGGRAWHAKDGAVTYYIERQIDGTPYQVKLPRGTSEHAAHVRLDEFVRNPGAFDARGSNTAPRLVLDLELAKAYLATCRKPEAQGGKENSPAWIQKKRRFVAWWIEALKGCDLHRTSLVAERVDAAINPTAADDEPVHVASRSHKIATIKDVFGWLVEHRKITTAEDATAALVVPQNAPAQRKRVRTFTREAHAAMLAELTDPTWRDLCVILAGTGWHVSEVQRFARGGEIEPLPRAAAPVVDLGTIRALAAAGVALEKVEAIVAAIKGETVDDAAGVLVTGHKSGDEHKTRVTADVLDAARRILARQTTKAGRRSRHGRRSEWSGGFCESRFYRAVALASKRAKLERPIHPGEYRHAVATWAVEAGASLDDVSTFLGHKSKATTKRFYATHAVAGKVPTLA